MTTFCIRVETRALRTFRVVTAFTVVVAYPWTIGTFRRITAFRIRIEARTLRAFAVVVAVSIGRTIRAFTAFTVIASYTRTTWTLFAIIVVSVIRLVFVVKTHILILFMC